MQGVLSDILKCLGDNKKHMRECTLNTLDSWVAAVHLDKMVIFMHVLIMCYFNIGVFCFVVVWCNGISLFLGSLHHSSSDRN